MDLSMNETSISDCGSSSEPMAVGVRHGPADRMDSGDAA